MALNDKTRLIMLTLSKVTYHLPSFSVTSKWVQLYPTTEQPCIKNTKYRDYICYESFFSKKRGCQYPWNIYKGLNVTVCSNYATIEALMYRNDLGMYREKFDDYKRFAQTDGQCPYPCDGLAYNVKIEKWENWRSGRSLQISLDNLVISTEEQYVSCDMTCIIGEFGGNLGFFLGGSLLFGFNVILEFCSQTLKKIHVAWQNGNLFKE